MDTPLFDRDFIKAVLTTLVIIAVVGAVLVWLFSLDDTEVWRIEFASGDPVQGTHKKVWTSAICVTPDFQPEMCFPLAGVRAFYRVK